MTSPVSNVLIIGGGFSGMSAAIQLRKLGLAVDLVEIDPGWRSYGAGISVGGAALRAFRALGVLDAVLAEGFCGDGVDLFTADGHRIGQLPTPRLAGPDVPGGGAIMRPVLAKILSDATLAAGAKVTLGHTFNALSQDAAGVDVSLTDGTKRRYDLVIGADGMYSAVRRTLFPDAPKPAYTGQGVWRAVLPRVPEIGTATMWLGPKIKTGVNPVSPTEMYLFVTEDRETRARIDPERAPAMLRELLMPFAAPVMQHCLEQIGPHSQVIYRPIENLLLRQPWSFGRIVLIGDTVHATTPHLASGAGIGIEDALVLAEELDRGGEVADALGRFQSRRWERCRMVVENSARLGEIEITGGDKQEHTRIMGESMAALARPI